MVDEEDARWAREVDGMYPCGAVERDGEVVGAWFTNRHARFADGRAYRTVTLLWRQDGGVAACHMQFGEGEDIVDWVSDRCGGPEALRAPAAEAFGRALLDMSADDGAHHVPSVVPPERVPAVAALHAARRHDTLHAFLSTLDPRAVALAARHGDLAAQVGKVWPAMDRSFGPDAPLADLLRARPAFALTLLRLAGMHPEMARALRDSPRELDAALSSTAGAEGVPKGFLPVLAEAEAFVTGLERRMGGAAYGEGRVARMRRDDRQQRDWAVALARRAARFPRGWAPSNEGQWDAFVDLCPVLDAVAGWCVERPELVRLVNSGGDWVAFRARLHAAAGAGAPVDVLSSNGVEGAVADIRDMAAAYARDVLRPACAATWGRPARHWGGGQDWVFAAWALLNSGRSLPRMLEASRDWHRRRARMAMAKAAMPTAHGDDLAWGRGLPDAVVQGIDFRVLSSEFELADEGRPGRNADGSEGLDNCIGGYSEDCLSGASRIMSLRVPGSSPPERLGVAEIHMIRERERLSFVVYEHRGPGNGEPSLACQAALDAYVGGLASGELPVDAAGLEPLSIAGDLVARECRFDWTDVASRAEVRKAWDRLVPPALRAMPEEELSALACANLRAFNAWSAKALAPEPQIPEASSDGGWEAYDEEPAAPMTP